MRAFILIITLFYSFNTSSQCLGDTVVYLEWLPECSDCNKEIEAYINNKISSIDYNSIDTLKVCFEIDSSGVIRNIFFAESVDQNLIKAISEAILSVATWTPAYGRNKTISSKNFIKIRFHKKIEICSTSYNSSEENDYLSRRNNRLLDLDSEPNSNEIITHVSVNSIFGYIIKKLSLPNGNFNSLQKKSKSQKLIVSAKGNEVKGILIIPKLKFEMELECRKCKELTFKSIPVDHELYLIIVGKLEDRLFIHIEKRNSVTEIDRYIDYNEYTFSELSKLINLMKKNNSKANTRNNQLGVSR
jgi:hypothetical protein